MKKGFKTLPVICWTLAVIVTALVYWLLVDGLFSFPVKWISVCFVLLAEILLCFKSLTKKLSIITSPQLIFGGIYLFVTFIMSVIYINLSDPNIKWFISLHAVLLVILAIADLTVGNFQKQFDAADRQLAKNQSVMSACGVLIDTIIAENPNTDYQKDLTAISEALRYADNSILSGDEGELAQKLEALRNLLKSGDNNQEIRVKINDIKSLIKVRELYIKQNQRGKY